MAVALPSVLRSLLAAGAPATRDQAWAEFLDSHSKLLLFVARSFGGDYDAVMDRYACLLDHLSRDNFHRLRAFAEDGRSEFTTWLVVVAQRICLDHHRHRYGRVRSSPGSTGGAAGRAARRSLADLVGAPVDVAALQDPLAHRADDRVCADETAAALNAALGALAPRDQMLLRFRFEDGLPMAEVARLLGHPTRFHTHRRLRQLLALLRAKLAGHAGDGPSVEHSSNEPDRA